MYCPYCGKLIPDESKFCGECGKNVGTIKAENLDGKNAERTHIHKKAFFSIRTLALFVIMIVFIGGILYGMIRSDIFESKINMSDFCVILSDGEYRLVPLNQKTGENDIKIADFENTSTNGSVVNYMDRCAHITKDGKYLYFFSKLDDYGEYGNLYRAELGKLRAGSDKNDAYVIKIASGVSTEDLEVCEDNTVVYKKKNSDDDYIYRLYYFDGVKSDVVAKDVYTWEICEDYIFYTSIEEDEVSCTLYGRRLGSEENEIKIAAYIDSEFYVKDPEHIVYFKTISDEYRSHRAVYIAGYSTEPEKLSGDVYYGTWYSSFAQTGKFYYTEMSGEDMYLSDFVENPYADSDKEAIEPDYYDEKYEDDYEAYETDYEAYEAATERLDLMAYLSDLRCDSRAYSLYYYDISAGQPVLISDQVDNYQISYTTAFSNGHTAVAYFKRQDTIEKINIERVIDEYDETYSDAEALVIDYVRSNSADVDMLYCTVDGEKEQTIDPSLVGLDSVSEDECEMYLRLAIYNDGKNLAFCNVGFSESGTRINSDNIYIASVNGQEIGEFESVLAVDTVNIGAFGDKLGYYNADYDFYMYINNRQILLSEDEWYTARFTWYPDGSALVMTHYDYEGGWTLMRMTESGETEVVMQGVTCLDALQDGEILYIADGDLRFHDGKENDRLIGNAEYCWSADAMDGVG